MNAKWERSYASVEGVFYETNKLGFFSCTEQIKPVSIKEVKRFISLESALDLVKSKYSGFSSMNVEEISPRYILVNDYKLGTYAYKKGNKVHLKPVYQIIIPKSELSTEFNNYCYINVDMQTGEIDSNLEEAGDRP